MESLENELFSYDYYAILDFEATCENNCRTWKNEIIEFPTVIVDSKTLEVVEEFQQFVKPVLNPKLTDFCTELTGITQETVDTKGLPCEDVLKNWYRFMSKYPNHLLICCGDWDFKTMLPLQLQLLYGPQFVKFSFKDGTFNEIVADEAYLSHLKRSIEGSRDKYSPTPLPGYPLMVPKWCNVKICFYKAEAVKAGGMPKMLSHLGLTLEGRHHSGIDDCRNIARIAVALIKKHGYSAIYSTTKFRLSSDQIKKMIKN